MLLRATILIFASALLASGQELAAKTDQSPPGAPPACPVTLPDGKFTPKLSSSHGESADSSSYATWFGGDVRYGTEKLWTVLPSDGVWRGSGPTGPYDFAYANKLPWWRTNPPFHRTDDPLTVTGKRLDGPAPAFTETFESSGLGPDYSGEGIMGGIEIPVFGCWQITGRYKDAELAFTIWVAPPDEKTIETSLGTQQPPSPEPAPLRVSVDGEVQAKSLVYRVTPELPPDAITNVGGTVVLQAIIDTRGRPQKLAYLSGPPQLIGPAMNAVRWWQYRVEMVNEEAAEVETTIKVEFPGSGD